MIIGAGRSGKSALGRWLDQQDWFPGAARGENPDSWNRRTPTLVYRGAVIEAPGAYLESPWMRHHLIAAAQDACCVLMLADSTGKREIYPPGFARVFPCTVLGVVTKCDLTASDGRRMEACFKQLARAGIRNPFLRTSILDQTGLKALGREVKGCLEAAGIKEKAE